MRHDLLCPINTTHDDGDFSHVDCGYCRMINKAHARGFEEGYKEALAFTAEQAGMRLSRKAQRTSVEAVNTTLPRSGTKLLALWDLFMDADNNGMTDDEIELRTGWTHQSASAARNALMMRGLLTDSQRLRKNRRGLNSIVWIKESPASKDTNDREPATDDRPDGFIF